jgi:hypothetical protein
LFLSALVFIDKNKTVLLYKFRALCELVFLLEHNIEASVNSTFTICFLSKMCIQLKRGLFMRLFIFLGKTLE